MMGMQAGVDSIVVTPLDSSFETIAAKIQVADSPASLQLQLVSGGGQTGSAGAPLPSPIVLRVTDINNLPYPSVLVNATVTGGGSLDSNQAISDTTGTVHFVWTPGDGPNELHASIPNGPEIKVVLGQ